MRLETRLLATATVLLSILPLASEAWKSPPAGVVTIAEARERADIGDYMVIEGIVVESDREGYFEIEDATGRMLVFIPDFITRNEGRPEKSELIRVAGKYDKAKLDQSLKGIRVMTLWRGEPVTGGRGPAEPPATSENAREQTPRPMPPAAVAQSNGSASMQRGSSNGGAVYRATAQPEMVARLAEARREWLDAMAELEEASNVYARALYEAGNGGTVDPSLSARNDAAEERVQQATDRIPGLVEEARAAGVSEDVLRLYVQMTTRTR